VGVALVGAAPGEAQITIGGSIDERCECVDRDGNRIEDCVCVRRGESPLQSFSLARVGRRAQIGVYLDMGQDDAAVGGVKITEVMEDSPADAAGLRAGDVVLSVDGVSVRDRFEADEEGELDDEGSLFGQRFVAIVGDLEPEQEVDMVVLRDGERRTLRITPERASMMLGLAESLGEGRYDFRVDPQEMEAMQEAMERAREAIEERRFGIVELRELREEDRRRVEEELDRARKELRGMSFRFERDRAQERARVEEERAEMDRLGLLRREGGGLVPGRGFTVFGDDPCIRLRAGRGSAVTILGGGSCVDGVELAEMNEGLSVYFGTDEGVLVTEVAEGSALGLEAGDVVLRVGDREVADIEGFRRILGSYDLDESVAFRVRRDNREINVSGTRRAP
jgi:C-terminal processing protease CtpA/Prc